MRDLRLFAQAVAAACDVADAAAEKKAELAELEARCAAKADELETIKSECATVGARQARAEAEHEAVLEAKRASFDAWRQERQNESEAEVRTVLNQLTEIREAADAQVEKARAEARELRVEAEAAERRLKQAKSAYDRLKRVVS